MEWGEAIEVNGVRPDWLRGPEKLVWLKTFDWLEDTKQLCDVPAEDWAWSHSDGRPNIVAIKLPDDHPYYTVQAHNAKHGTNFAYWPGGDNAPEDWDGGEILSRAGSKSLGGDWIWSRYGGPCNPGHIIGYTRKAADKPVGDHVSVKCVTEWEARKMLAENDYDIIKVLDSLGIIRCTREERFTQETGIIVTPDVRAALEWKE